MNSLKKLLNMPLVEVMTLFEGGSERHWVPLHMTFNLVMYAFFVGVISGGLLGIAAFLLGQAA